MSVSKKITIRLSEEQYNNVMKEAAAQGVTVSDYIRSRISSSGMIDKKIVLGGLTVLCNSINQMEEDNTGYNYYQNVNELKRNVINLWSMLSK